MIMKKIIKPWGYEKLLELNKKYVVKELFMKKGHRCSLQFHKKKIETFYVVSGKLKLYSGKSKDNLKIKYFVKGDYMTIKPKFIHRMEAVTNSIYLEASTPEITDVVRLIDDYNRS